MEVLHRSISHYKCSITGRVYNCSRPLDHIHTLNFNNPQILTVRLTLRSSFIPVLLSYSIRLFEVHLLKFFPRSFSDVSLALFLQGSAPLVRPQGVSGGSHPRYHLRLGRRPETSGKRPPGRRYTGTRRGMGTDTNRPYRSVRTRTVEGMGARK